MHESTQRLICRIGFVLLCLAPTVYVAGWAAAVNTPLYEASRRARWEEILSERLGMQASIGHVVQASRGVVLLQDVKLIAPESQTPLVRVRVVEVRRYEEGWLVSASQIEADADELESLWAILHDHLMVRAAEQFAPVWLSCSELTLQGGRVEQTLVGVSAKYHAASGVGPEIMVKFQLPDRLGDEACQLTLSRDRSLQRVATSVRLDTKGAALPCSVLGGSLAFVELLGPRAKFQGMVELRSNREGMSGKLLNADLLDVETQRLVTACSLHTFRTRANVRIESAEFRDGRMQSIVGGVAAEFGVIDSYFVRALHREMQIAAPDEMLDSPTEKISFTQLAFDFALDAKDGLYVQGAVGGGAYQSAIMSGKSGPILLQPQRPHVTAVSLIRALTPQNDVQAPATQQTRQLVNALPVPDIARASPDPPRATIQIRKTR